MSSKNLFIRNLSRSTFDGKTEELSFDVGINVLVGQPNTGKSGWLKMLNYLFGKTDSPEISMGNDLAKKYCMISANFVLGDEEILIQRSWKGQSRKITFGDLEIRAHEFSEIMFDKLGFPILHFPQGDPYSERTWSNLSWRMLYRHIYRREESWVGDLISKQPQSEQHACLAQFLGIAEKLFPDEYGKLVEKRKKVNALASRKENFFEMLAEVSKELLSSATMAVAPTNETVESTVLRIKSKIDDLGFKRENIITSLKKNMETDKPSGDSELENLASEWAELNILFEKRSSEKAKLNSRLSNLREYNAVIENELKRLSRVKIAGEILADLKVTHCPVCDKEVELENKDEDNCFLCQRPYHLTDGKRSLQRIEFEKQQLSEEVKENKSLIIELEKEQKTIVSNLKKVADRIKSIDSKLAPVRSATAALSPPELTMLDQEIGKLYEQLRFMAGIKKLLKSREDITKKIDDINSEINLLDSELKEISSEVKLGKQSNVLSDGMNTYLNNLGSEKWPEPQVNVRLKERSFEIFIGDGFWNDKLGATLQCYFLMAYQYALMSLSNKENYNYPGFAVIDFPPTFAENTEMANYENYVIDPFLKLFEQPGMEKSQIIVTGRSFSGLEGANRIVLDEVWGSD